jgi:aspartokinase-like uncharacterized kinase
MKHVTVRVVKLGGSLLNYADLPNALRRWLARQSLAHHVIVVGGGEWVDCIRRACSLHGLDQAAAHGLCVDLLSVTSRLVAELLPEACVVSDYPQLCKLLERDLPSCEPPRFVLFDPRSYLHEDETRLPGTRLQQNWDVTSDSIAARLAITIGANQFVLLKSVLPCSPHEMKQLVASGYVDPYFQELADELPPTFMINLRAEDFPTARLMLD